jgi:hypothetical protein
MSLFFERASVHVEVRIRSAQPPSRGFSGSLPAFGTQSGRSPEIRHRMAMLLREESLETPAQCESVQFLFHSLSRPVLGVTLADHPDLPPIELPSR